MFWPKKKTVFKLLLSCCSYVFSGPSKQPNLKQITGKLKSCPHALNVALLSIIGTYVIEKACLVAPKCIQLAI